MDTECEIRRASEDDAEAIATVLYESFADYRPLYTSAGFAATTPAGPEVRKRSRKAPFGSACATIRLSARCRCWIRAARARMFEAWRSCLPPGAKESGGGCLSRLRRLPMSTGTNACSSVRLPSWNLPFSSIRGLAFGRLMKDPTICSARPYSPWSRVWGQSRRASDGDSVAQLPYKAPRLTPIWPNGRIKPPL